jgi:hypothetical protein
MTTLRDEKVLGFATGIEETALTEVATVLAET